MSNLVFEPKWNASINQVEAGEEIRGGKDGTANIATKQLAENIFYLKDNIYSLVGYIPPDLSEDMADIVQNTKDKFDSVINQIVIQNDAILAESRDRIAEVTATNAALALERDERIAKYDAINADLSEESAARIQAILDEQFQRSEEILASAITQEALLAAESKAIRDKLFADALELNNIITALGSRVDTELDGITQVITQTSEDLSSTTEANANILNALKLEYEGNKASVLEKYTALADEQSAQSELLVNLRASVDGAQTELTNFKTATATKDLATATEISNISSKVDDNEASFNTQITTVTDNTTANTTQITTLSGKMDTVEGQTADLIVKNTALTTLTDSTAEALTLLQSAYGLSTASFDERITTVTNDNSALTTKVTNLESSTDDSLASIRLKQDALTTEDEALATSISTLTTTFEGQTAQFSDQLTALTNENEATLQKTENLRAQLVGGYDGTDLDQVSEGLLHQEKLARVNDKESLVQQIGLLASGVGEQFDPKEIWHFSSDPEGWIGGVFEQGQLRVTNETVISPAFSLSGTAYRYTKLRIKRTGAPTWEGKLTYNNTLDVPGEVVIPEPIFVNDIATIDIDTKWVGEITDIQLKLASTGDELNYILIDWIAIGRPSPGASSAALLDLKTTSASRDEALTQSISQLNAALNTKTATLESTINTKTETLTTAQQTQATNLVTLESKIDNIDSTLSSSISRNDETITTKHDALAATVTTLKSDTDAASALVTSQLETLTTADSALGIRIDSLSTSLDGTKADIIATNKTFVDEDAALALSIGALTATLDDNTAAINTQLESLVTQDASFASDLSSLSVRFGSAEDTIAQNSVDILAETSARADAISAQATKTDTLEVKVDGNNSSITSRLDAEVTKTNATAESLTVLRGEFDTNSATYINKFKSITDAASAEAIKLDAVTTEFGTNKSTVAGEITTINNAATSLAQQVTQLSSNFNTNTTDYTTKFKALTDKDISLGTAITDLTASFTSVDGLARQNTVDITEESRVRADAVSAEATRITALTTKVDGNIAEVNTKTAALTTSVAANASQLTTIAGEVAGNKATIKSNNDIQVALNSVTANKLDYVSAEIEGGYSDKTHYALKNKTIQWTRTTSIAEALFNTNEKVNNLNSEFGQNIASFSESIKTLANENMALSERTTAFSANYDADKVQNTANITSINQAIATNTGAITSFDTRLTVEYIPKIDNLEANINNINVGGRNLLRDSNVSVSNNVYDMKSYVLTEAPNVGDDIVITIWGTLGADRTSFVAYNSGGWVSIGDLALVSPGIYRYVGKWVKGTASDTFLQIWQFTSAKTSTSTINAIKLEKGNIGTEWSPAPEDTASAIQGSLDIGNSITTEFGKLKAETKVLTDIGGKISGWKNYNTGTTSSFDILADNFSVGNSGVMKKPFSIVGNDITFNGKVSFNSVTDTGVINKAINDINNLEIGGRNLLKAGTISANNSSITKGGDIYTITTLANAYTWGNGLSLNVPAIIDWAESFTISMEIYTTESFKFNADINNYGDGTQSGNDNDDFQYRRIVIDGVGNSVTGAGNTAINNVPVNRWFKASITYRNSDSTKNPLKNPLSDSTIFGLITNKVHVYKIRNVKAEKGNKPTGWSPAPEDIDSSISAASAIASTALGNASTAQTKANQAFTNAGTAQGRADQAYTQAGTAEINAKNYALLSDKIVVIDSITKKFLNPAGYSAEGNVTGYLIIETPIEPTRMIKVHISGYNYQGSKSSIDLSVGCYVYTGNAFINYDYTDTGTYPIGNVRLAYKGGKAVIIIGNANSVWSYPKIEVASAIVGYVTPPDSYKDGWNIRVSTSIADMVGVITIDNNSSISLQGIHTNVYYPNTTEINGGNIRTKTIAADSIVANSITAGQMAANSITANEINVANLAAISANIGNITAGSIKGVSIEVGATSIGNGPGCEVGTILRANPSGFQIMTRDETGGIELSSATRALTVWEGDKIRVKVGKLS